MMELMAEHMAGVLKRGRPETTKAMKKQERPTFQETNKPTDPTKKQELKFAYNYKHWIRMESNWEETSGHIFEMLSSHCSPNTKTKLWGMVGRDKLKQAQDGISLICMLHQIYFDQDGSK